MPLWLKALISAIVVALITATNVSCAEDQRMTQDTDSQELIILMSPKKGDTYYADMAEEILRFQLVFAQQIAAHDRVLVLTDQKNYSYFADSLGEQRVLISPQDDIWARDFSPSNTTDPVMFRYTAAGQGGGGIGQVDADSVQAVFESFVTTAGLRFAKSALLNDGGNFVDDYAGNVIISTKFLADNRLTENKARKLLLAMTGINNVAFIEADEQGGLQHADGVVAFIDENLLAINSYPDDPDYMKQLKSDLKRGLPNIKIFELITPYDDSGIYDERFGSACGIYTNMLVTKNRIYLPQFGIKEDVIALQQIRAMTKKQVIPVQSGTVCQMGGGVRCMSAQFHGIASEQLLRVVGKPANGQE
ncbi:MAG: agmatine deiminase family protein [Robiginitomaculum sp.]|nr:agmatine deiminase family protein [Robiginitomaculum sp.]